MVEVRVTLRTQEDTVNPLRSLGSRHLDAARLGLLLGVILALAPWVIPTPILPAGADALVQVSALQAIAAARIGAYETIATALITGFFGAVAVSGGRHIAENMRSAARVPAGGDTQIPGGT